MFSAETARPGVGESCGGFVSGTLRDTALSPGAELESPEGLLKRKPPQPLQLFPHAAVPQQGAPGVRSLATCFLPGEGGKPRAREKREACRLQAVPLQA